MRTRKPWLIATGLILSAAVALVPRAMAGVASGESTDPGAAAAGEEDLEALTAQEQAALAELFALNRQLEETRDAIAELDRQGEELSRDLESIRQRLETIRGQQQEGLARMGKRLRWMQVHGTLAPVAVLLNADSLRDFLDRLETVTWLMQRDADLLQELRDLNAAASAEEGKLADRQAEWADVRKAQTEREQELLQAIAQKEAILSSLKDRRVVVEAALARIEEDWATAALPVLEALGSSLLGLDVAAIQPDIVQATLFPPGAVVHISAESLNDLLAHGELADMAFRIEERKVGLEGVYAGVPVQVWGTLDLLGDSVVRFQPSTMQVRDFTVPQQVAEQFADEGWFDIDLSDLVDPFVLKEVRMQSGELILRAGR